MIRKIFYFLLCIIISIAILAACAKSTEIVTVLSQPTDTQMSATKTQPPSINTPYPPTPTDTQVPPVPTSTYAVKTIVVSSTADSGPNTFRQALLDAESGDVITFDPFVFPPDTPTTIALSNSLPELTQGSLAIDASNAGVILDGRNITTPDSQRGLSISSDYNLIRGLQITGFSDAGIGLYGGAQYNIIGGDRGVGDGRLGQGNLISGNGNFGVGLWDEDTSYNTIQGNYIGINIDGTETWGHARDGIHSNGATQTSIIDNIIGGNEAAGVYLCCVLDGGNTITDNLIGVGPDGSNLGNTFGVLIDRTRHNVVGPGNTIANNHGDGVSFWENTPNNTVTQNSIHDNDGRGIGMSDSQNTLQPPLITSWDLQAGTLVGAACANCMVEIFSDEGKQGAVYEGQVATDSKGSFYYDKNVAFSRPRLTGTVTDSTGTTSTFSLPTNGSGKEMILQAGNDHPVSRIDARCSTELIDNHIGTFWGHVKSVEVSGNACAPQGVRGFTMVKLAFNEVEDWPYIDWSQSEFDIQPELDALVTSLAENGITVTYMLNFWDKANHPNGWPVIPSRFTTEEEIQRYLEYVRFIVGHFKDRVSYYELWNEPDNQGSAIQHIRPEDYIKLVKRVVPVIRDIYPEAKIVVGSVSYLRGPYAHDWLYHIIQSDIMPLIDVVAWHPMYGTSPDYGDERDYYYAYPGLLQDIKETAIAHGFQGEFRGDEIGWCSPDIISDCGAALHKNTNIAAAKYHGRGIVIHLGMGVTTHLGGVHGLRQETKIVVNNLATLLAGAEAESFPYQVHTTGENVVSYTFVLPNGDQLAALWTDGIAVEDDPGVSATLTFPDSSTQKVIGIDVLHGFEQQLITETENGNLIVRNFLIKDYPIFLRLIP